MRSARFYCVAQVTRRQSPIFSLEGGANWGRSTSQNLRHRVDVSLAEIALAKIIETKIWRISVDSASAHRLYRIVGMARPKRIIYAGATYHVMARANGSRRLIADEFDRLRLFELFGEVQQRYCVRWRCFSLMTSHYHAEPQTIAPNLPEAMRYLNSQYAIGWNRRRRTRGHVFGDRFRSKAIEDAGYAWRAVRYITWNPVESGYVIHPD